MRKNSRFLHYKPRKINLNLCRINLILSLKEVIRLSFYM